MIVKSYAKINLALDILGRSGAYHQIRSVMRQIGLHDEIRFAKCPGKKITVACGNPSFPAGPSNTMLKAARILKKYAARKSLRENICGIKITVKKNIPVSAGLGGGSSNGAAAMMALNKIWRLRIPVKSLQKLAARIGMDAPFFMGKGSALATGRGEKVKPLPPCKLPPMLVALSGKKTSTKDVYRMLDLKKTGRKMALTSALVAAIKAGKPPALRSLAHNDFETLLARREMAAPAALFNSIAKTAPLAAGLCGSGPAVYALYKTAKERDAAMKAIMGKTGFLWKSGKGIPPKKRRPRR